LKRSRRVSPSAAREQAVIADHSIVRLARMRLAAFGRHGATFQQGVTGL
jgi:hypothetical protein